MDPKKYRIHFIDEISDKMVAIQITSGVPRVGDEIRVSETLFYEVIRIVWCYDEPSPYERINIGVRRAVE